jgi:hypothetical protein
MFSAYARVTALAAKPKKITKHQNREASLIE